MIKPLIILTNSDDFRSADVIRRLDNELSSILELGYQGSLAGLPVFVDTYCGQSFNCIVFRNVLGGYVLRLANELEQYLFKG